MRPPRQERSPFERFYSVVVLVKGVDGAGELVLGALLLLAPLTVQHALAVVAGELGEGLLPWQQTLADAVADAGASVRGTAVTLAAFLVVHGLVKLATVYCLIRRLVRLHPWALAVLGVLLAVQLVAAIGSPTIGAWVLVALDVLVVVLVALEYRRLFAARAGSREAADDRDARPVAASER